jgi:hypothetical protein
MRTVVFLDLDDTLFQTLAKCPEEGALHPAAYNRDGSPLSYMTDRQRTLLELLAPATVIPTTARNLDAFRRVRLPWPSLAILDFGGVVLLPDGAPDAEWDARIRPAATKIGPELGQWSSQLRRFSEGLRLNIGVRVIHDFDMPLYVVLKHPAGDVESLNVVRRDALHELDEERFFLHHNDNNLSIVPRFLGKERAVRYVLERHFGPEPVLTIGVGDSLSDAAFLNICDFRMVPRGCQLDSFCRSNRKEP